MATSHGQVGRAGHRHVGPGDFVPDKESVQRIIEEAVNDGIEWLDATQAQALLKTCEIPGIDTRNAVIIEEAAEAASQIGYPVALKVVSSQVIDRPDVGGVVLGLQSSCAVRSAATAIQNRLISTLPGFVMTSFTVQAMVSRPGARKLIVGIAADTVFGPVILVGQDGTSAGLSKNSAMSLPPLNPACHRRTKRRCWQRC